MRSYCTKYLAPLPDITVCMNCDTRFAINLHMFNLGENDEFIFTIKNYDYINSPYVFLFRARLRDMDTNGEVIFKITPEASKYLKPGAFYNFAALLNAFDTRKETEYRKLTGNGNIVIEYGAHDLSITTGVVPQKDAKVDEILDIHLELVEDGTVSSNSYKYEIQGLRLEPLEETPTAAVDLADISSKLASRLKRG